MPPQCGRVMVLSLTSASMLALYSSRLPAAVVITAASSKVRPSEMQPRAVMRSAPKFEEAEAPPPGIDLERAAAAALTRGCWAGMPRHGDANGVACRKAGLDKLLSLPVAERFVTTRRNPCTAAKPSRCIPFFYVLGAFHSGVRDLFGRLQRHPLVFTPKARHDGSYPFYFSETHPWERMLWRA